MRRSRLRGCADRPRSDGAGSQGALRALPLCVAMYELGFPPVVERAQALEIENDVTLTQSLLVGYVTSALTNVAPTIVDPYP